MPINNLLPVQSAKQNPLNVIYIINKCNKTLNRKPTYVISDQYKTKVSTTILMHYVICHHIRVNIIVAMTMTTAREAIFTRSGTWVGKFAGHRAFEFIQGIRIKAVNVYVYTYIDRLTILSRITKIIIIIEKRDLLSL